MLSTSFLSYDLSHKMTMYCGCMNCFDNCKSCYKNGKKKFDNINEFRTSK